MYPRVGQYGKSAVGWNFVSERRTLESQDDGKFGEGPTLDKQETLYFPGELSQ